MSDAFSRLARALSSSYRLTRELGSGGMATVFLADDLRHERQVAVKVMRPELAAVLGAERFLREIKVTARLQHPHILPLFDSGVAEGFLYHVTPYIAGGSLRDKLVREKQLPVEEAVSITAAVGEALGYAHRHGVTHRDIKPENILLHDGQPMIADFGIALAVSEAGGTRLTETGLSIGTPEYVSPEQGSGDREIDPRTDVYALGCVLYELLTGHPPHTGATTQAIVAKILTDTPAPVERERDTVPLHVSRAVAKALRRLPADRYPTGREFAADLVGPGVHSLAPGGAARPWLSDPRTLLTLVASTAAVVVALLFGPGRSPPPSPGIMALSVALPPDRAVLATEDAPLAISRDGSTLVYVGSGTPDEGGRRLYVRRVDRLDPVPLPDTEGARRPFISPDGEWVAFVVGDQLRKMPIAGGPPLTIADSVRGLLGGATWLDDGTIVYPVGFGGLARVSDTGGSPTRIFGDSTVLAGNVTALPGGRGIVFLRAVVTEYPLADIVAMELPSGRPTVLVEDATVIDPLTPTRLLATTSGHLVFGQSDGMLVAAELDPEAPALRGAPVPVIQRLLDPSKIAISDDGTLVYMAGGRSVGRRVSIVDRSGVALPLSLPVGTLAFVRFSPDGERLALEIHNDDGGHTYVYDLTSITLDRLTSVGHNPAPIWSPDGSRVAYGSAREDRVGIFNVSVDGRGVEQEVYRSRGGESFETRPTAWSPDGRWILFDRIADSGETDVLVVGADGGEARPFLAADANESGARFSPDGRWVAYQSDASGGPEVYVTAFPEPAGRWPVSAGGGFEPVWRGDEIFYRRADGLYAATVEVGGAVRVTGRHLLFDDTDARGIAATFDVSPDGRRVVLLRPAEAQAELVMVVNWFRELRERLGQGR